MLAFDSTATNYVTNDTNHATDVFVRDRYLNPAVIADLKLSQKVNANPVAIGNKVKFTATITNAGPDVAKNVTLVQLPPLKDQVGHQPAVIPSQGACYRGVINICHLGWLAAGHTATVEMLFNAKAEGTVVNTVSVNAIAKDPTPTNNKVLTKATIVP